MHMATSDIDKPPTMSEEHEEDNEQEPVENNTKIDIPKRGLNPLLGTILIRFLLMAKCIHCKKQLIDRSNDGTTHLKDEYMICPRKNTRDIRQHILVQGKKTTDGKAYMSKYSFDNEISRDEIAKMIIIHDYPRSIVEHYGFRKYTESLQPLFKVPCCNTVKGAIMKVYEDKKFHILKCFERTIVGLLSRLICGQQVTKRNVTWESQHIIWITTGSYKIKL
uniref:Uncharacterized protein n=1 Tax=Lactuca sativa TaxID=4236 RepID=A0A9R1UNY0_LACSA|nr:hypothetical protein LSAT_V11C800422620 [Lactuca sativa]